MMIKQLSGKYPLHEMVFVRSAIGICFTAALIQWEGGWRILKTDQPGLHVLRGLLIVVSNLTFFTALAAIPLAEATALFFAAPLFITLLSVPILGEKVGPLRLSAVAIGFVGVLIMLRPWQGFGAGSVPFVIYLLPVAAALTYALNQIITRKVGARSKASAMAAYIQGMFIVVSSIWYLVFGDGTYAEGLENESLLFLTRAWVWPEGTDLYWFIGLGIISAVIGYSISQAYRLTDAATVAPFEYAGLPLAVFWGWLIWSELPGPEVTLGIVLIAGSGLFVFLRERQAARLIASRRANRRY